MKLRPWMMMLGGTMGCGTPSFDDSSRPREDNVIPEGGHPGVQIGSEGAQPEGGPQISPMGCEWQPSADQSPVDGVMSPRRVEEGLTPGLSGRIQRDDGRFHSVELDLPELVVWWDHCMKSYLISDDDIDVWIDDEVWPGRITLVGAPPEDLVLMAWVFPDAGSPLGEDVSLDGVLGLHGGEGEVIGYTPGLAATSVGAWELDRVARP